MDLLNRLQKSRVAATLPDSAICQPTEYDGAEAGSKADPFADMINMEAVVEQHLSSRNASLDKARLRKSCVSGVEPTETVATRGQPSLDAVLNGILFALDGTFQLLGKADALQKVDAFLKTLMDDLAAKTSLKACKIRWLSPRVDKVREELASKRLAPPSPDFLEFLSAHLGAGVTVCALDGARKTCVESGWARHGFGVVLMCSASEGMTVVDAGAQTILDSGLRVISATQKAEALRANYSV